MSEGASSYIGLGYEVREGVPGPILDYIPFENEAWNPQFSREPNPNISSRGIAGRGRTLEVPIGGTLQSAPNPESTCRLTAHSRGKVVSAVLVAGAIQHTMTKLYPDDAAEAVYRETLNGVVYRDDDVPMTILGGKVRQRQIVIQARDYVRESFDLAWLHYGETDAPVADVGNTGTFNDALKVRGVRGDPDSALDVLIEATTAGALDGTAVIKARVGAGAFGGADTAIPVTARTWIKLIDENGNPIGPDWDQPLEVYFDDVTTATLVLADKFTIGPSLPVVSPTYSTRRVLAASQVSVTILGVGTYVIETATFTHGRPVDSSFGIGSIFAGTNVKNGMETFSLQFSRKYVDRTFINSLRSGASAAYTLDMLGDKIGATIYREQHKIDVLTADFDEAGTRVANADALDEQVVVTAYDDGSTEACTDTFVNTLASGTV